MDAAAVERLLKANLTQFDSDALEGALVLLSFGINSPQTLDNERVSYYTAYGKISCELNGRD